MMAGRDAKFFAGKALNPTHYYAFKSEERREAYIEEFFTGPMLSELKVKPKGRHAAKAIKEKAANEMKVGDIYCISWGYDQTNVHFYKVLRVVDTLSSAVIV